jgi:hypothetical protein
MDKTYSRAVPAVPRDFPLSSFFGIVRLDNPNSAAIPSSRNPRKSSPSESENPPMTNALSSSSSSSPAKSASSSRTSTCVCANGENRGH